MSLSFAIEFDGDRELLAATDRIQNMDQRPAHRRFHREHYLPESLRRYKLIRAQTPYSPRSVGTRKRASGKRRGYPGDPGFGFDSGTLERHLTTEETLLIGSDYSEVGSDLHYAPRIDELAERKGPFPGQGILFITEQDGEEFENSVYSGIEREWVR